VYLGKSLVGWRADGDAEARWQTTSTVDDGLARLAAWCTEDATPKRLRVWLGSSLAKPWMLPADAGVRSDADARVLAVATAADATGWSSTPKVWTGPWRPGHPTVCVAIPGVLASALAGAGRADGRAINEVESVRPWWNLQFDAALDRSRAEHVACGWSVAEPDGLVCGLARDGQLEEVRFEAPKRHDADWALLRRRLAINWPADVVASHRRFAPDSDGAWPIASAPVVNLDEAAA
jgi:hypothetical protein